MGRLALTLVFLVGMAQSADAVLIYDWTATCTSGCDSPEATGVLVTTDDFKYQSFHFSIDAIDAPPNVDTEFAEFEEQVFFLPDLFPPLHSFFLLDISGLIFFLDTGGAPLFDHSTSQFTLDHGVIGTDTPVERGHFLRSFRTSGTDSRFVLRDSAAVPEPTTLTILVAGLVALVGARRRTAPR